jgi:hypothetical protein
LSEAYEDIKRRCETAGIEYDDEGSLTIYLPWGEQTYPQFVQDGPHAEWVAGLPFEYYVMLKGFEASWSRGHRVIECDLVLSDRRGISTFSSQRRLITNIVRHLRQKGGIGEDTIDESDLEARREHVRERLRDLQEEYEESRGRYQWEPGVPRPSDEAERFHFEPVNGLSLSIGHSSNVHSFVQEAHGLETGPEGEDVVDVGRSLTLQIGGTDVTNHEDAVELLERIGNSLMFQIDISYDLGLTLERDRLWGYVAPVWERREGKEPKSLPPIRYQYDRQAMSLYWYAKAAAAMPLLQFLAYYQIIEFYFPKYAQSKALSTIRNVLKDPRFDVVRDTDVMRVFEAIKLTSKGRFRSEVQQLEAAVEQCIQPEELREFLLGDEERYGFYDSERQTKTDGVEAYLDQSLNPLVDERSPSVTPIPVKCPRLSS